MDKLELATKVDELGYLRAKLAKLSEQAKELEKELKAHGAGKYAGLVFNATVSDVNTDRVDWKKVALKLNPSHQLLTAHTKHTHSLRLNVTAKKVAA